MAANWGGAKESDPFSVWMAAPPPVRRPGKAIERDIYVGVMFQSYAKIASRAGLRLVGPPTFTLKGAEKSELSCLGALKAWKAHHKTIILGM